MGGDYSRQAINSNISIKGGRLFKRGVQSRNLWLLFEECMGYVISRQGIEGLGSTFGSILPSISYELVGGHACGSPGESLAPSLRVDFYCCIIFT